ncbi:MAG: S-methyl-5-thioribose-1-phosphate isomerase [bacterium]
MIVVEAVRWSVDGTAVDIIDQRCLPGELVRRELRTVDAVCDAIATLAVRGAPAIGIAGAMGLVVSLAPCSAQPRAVFLEAVRRLGARIGAVRPTAVNLSWAMARMRGCAEHTPGNGQEVHAALRADATAILAEDRAMCQRIGEHGLTLLPPDARVLTHCNAGALATGGIGTALAPIYLAAGRGDRVHVFADETRPLLQGSRLTAWELDQAGIDVTVLADSMAATLLRRGEVDLVMVGADRIAANGDVANKVGTYALAIAARHHGVPFYVAAPWSTVDPATQNGDAIEIEHRAPAELRAYRGAQTAPEDASVYNPAFDVTPAALVSAIITDRGIMRHPYNFAADGHSAAGEG